VKSGQRKQLGRYIRIRVHSSRRRIFKVKLPPLEIETALPAKSVLLLAAGPAIRTLRV
jgi:hypothetical protein